jgi:monovalent cation/hydrogen antiporter
MKAAEVLLLLLIVVAGLVTVARLVRIPYPVLLLVGGLALGAIPGLPHLEVEPETVLLLVLPPIVYVAAFFTPVRSFKQEIGNIVSLAIGLVVASTLAIAAITLAFVPAITVPLAVALGAIVSPPDAIAATAVAERLSVPRRVIALLEGESLVNDATALTIYRVAIAAALTGTSILALDTIGRFVVALVIGAVVGIAVGWIAAEIRTRLSDTPVEITVSLLTPYAAYLPADLLGGSGVIAALAAGLYLGRRASRIMGSDTRLAGRAVWEMVIFLINGFVFVVIGLQISSIAGRMDGATVRELALIGLVVSAALVLVRATWIYALAGWQRIVTADGQRLRPREALVLSWAGMRGVVSLAAVLAVPLSVAGAPGAAATPGIARDAVIVITFTVILVTLVGQGLTLPALIRALHLGGDDHLRHEESHARQDLIDAALRRIDELSVRWPDHQPLIEQLRTAYRHRAEHEEQLHEAPGSEAEQELVEHRQIRRAVIDAQRDELMAMRDRGAIDDDVLRLIERDLDLEEVRMEA